jgi:hypothetical protein
MVARLRLGLQHLICDEDCGPLLVSWAIALSAALAWLLLVYLMPPAEPLVQPPSVLAPALGDGVVTVDAGAGYKPAPGATAKGTSATVVRHRAIASPLDVAGAFAASALMRGVAEATRVIAGAEAVHGDVGRPIARADKSALGASGGAATPGMAQLGAAGGTGNGAGAANLGHVGRGATIERATFHAMPLPIVSAPALNGSNVDATELASFVRGRVAQLQSCYELARGTDLAGVVTLRITLGQAGSIRNADIVQRTWSGSGAVETEGCLLRVVRSWRLPSGSEGAAITLPISFTRS